MERHRNCTSVDTTGRYLVTLSDLTGALACWGVRQSPYGCPDNLELVVRQFRAAMIPKMPDGVAILPMLWCTFQSLEHVVRTTLEAIPAFVEWNNRKNGDKRPYGFTSSSYRPEPDDDFIDLDALYHNMVLMVLRNRGI